MTTGKKHTPMGLCVVQGNIALVCAAGHGYSAIVEVLLAHGANIESEDAQVLTSFHVRALLVFPASLAI